MVHFAKKKARLGSGKELRVEVSLSGRDSRFIATSRLLVWTLCKVLFLCHDLYKKRNKKFSFILMGNSGHVLQKLGPSLLDNKLFDQMLGSFMAKDAIF